jgi:capsular exopolysaccharide synthesis family protein
VLAKIKVEPVGQTDLIRVRAADRDPKRAADIANAAAEAYVSLSRDYNQGALKLAADAVAAKLDETRMELFDVARQITQRQSANKTVPEELKAQLQVGTGLFVTLSEKYEQLAITQTLEQGVGQIVSRAVTPGTPVRPRPVLNTILGLVVGLVLGFGGALLAEYLDNTIKTPEDVERYYGLPTLSRVPTFEAGSRQSFELALLKDSSSASAEAYRSLRTALEYLNFDGSLKTILVTSAAPREGKSTTLANLAVAIAQTGKRVLVIEGDFRRPTVHRFFNVNNDVGLSDVLTGKASLRAAIQGCAVPNLGILPCGAVPPNPSELLGSATMRSILDHAASVADFILLDSPPVLAVTDCAVLAPLVDGLLMVSLAGSSTREGAQRAVDVLRRSETRLLGVVLNGLAPAERYGYYYYDYYRATEAPQEPAVAGDQQASERKARRGGRAWVRTLGRIGLRILAVAAVMAVIAAVVVAADLALSLGIVKAIVSAVGGGPVP